MTKKRDSKVPAPYGFSVMVTGAGVFLEFAFWAGGEVEGELGVDGLGLGGGFDLEDEGEFFASGDGFVGDEFVALLGEGELGGGGAVAHGDGDALRGGGDDFSRGIEEADFDFLLGVDEELGLRGDGGDEAATVRGFEFFRRSGEGE